MKKFTVDIAQSAYRINHEPSGQLATRSSLSAPVVAVDRWGNCDVDLTEALAHSRVQNLWLLERGLNKPEQLTHARLDVSKALPKGKIGGRSGIIGSLTLSVLGAGEFYPRLLQIISDYIDPRRIGNSKPKQTDPLLHQEEDTRPPDKRVHAQTGHSDRKCRCGCGGMIPATARKNQKFIQDHRFLAYEHHACPICGARHRIKQRPT